MSSSPLSPTTPSRRRSFGSYAWLIGGGFLLLVLLVIAGLLLYSSTPDFANMVKEKVVAELEDATGGRVELQAIHWNLLHLAIEADNLTVHGLEGPSEVPYAHIDRLYLRAKIISLFGATIGLRYLQVDHPVFHLIVYRDGSTNQPTPKAKPKSSTSLTDTVFNLQANRVVINRGLALLNQRAIPIDVAANDLGAVVTYVPATDHYLGNLQIADLVAHAGTVAPVHSQLTLTVEAARNAADLKALHFISGSSMLDASGSVVNFANPQWKLSANGAFDLREIAALTAAGGQAKGTAELNLQAQGSGTDQFAVDGWARLVNAAYRSASFNVDGLSASTSLHITPEEISLPSFSARLSRGGSLAATIRYLHWRTPAPSQSIKAAQKSAPASRAGTQTATNPAGSVRARVSGFRLQTVLQMIAPRQYRNPGFDTAADGTVNADWAGSMAGLTAAVKLQLSSPRNLARGQIPLEGAVDARYFNHGGRVEIARFEAHTPATSIHVAGSLGVYPVTGPSAIQVHLKNSNLAEFDRVLSALGVRFRNGKGGEQIPVELHGSALFDGSVTGSLMNPAVQGHLTASDFSTPVGLSGTISAPGAPEPAALPAANSVASPSGTGVQSMQWDRLDATGAYSSSLISLQQATLVRGKTTIHASGELHAHRISARRSAFDDFSTLSATASMRNASLDDILAIAGENIPASGIVDFQLHAGGTLGDLTGGGNLSIQRGQIEGQSFHGLNADLSFSGHSIQLESLTLSLDGGTIVGNGSYRLDAKTFLINLDGTHFELARIPQLKNFSIPVEGSLKFDAHASGTLDSPSLLAGVHLDHLVLGGQPAGGLEAFAHTVHGAVLFTVKSSFPTAQLQATGQTKLQGDFPTQARLVFSKLDIKPFLQAFNVQKLNGSSDIGGTVDLEGPAKEPKELSGDADIDQFSVALQGMTLKVQGPLRASLRQGVVHISGFHIVGPATNLAVTGSVGVLGGQVLDISAKGSINMVLVETFDPDITSSGHVDFDVSATGTLGQPSFSGRARVTNVALALNDLPNGISKLNGVLAFNQNRLEVQDMTGMTGGGQLKIGGFITYQQGIYGDLTATGKDIRVRYSGLSATADSSLHLQGSETNMLLSGNVQITRFLIGSNLDFANFAGSPAAVALPNPNAPSSHVRLDIHITSSPQLDFQNSYAQLAGSVDLRIRGTVSQPAILGRINITDGTATFAGATYQLQRGEIYFTNPVVIEPIIDLDATTTIEEYDITLGLHGSLNHLAPTFRSEPPLPQADVISLLALGRTQEEQQIYSQEEQQAGVNSTTNALLGGALNAAVGSRVQKLFGVGSVKIDPSYVGNLGSSNARITVQQNISRTIQLTYATNVNTTAEQLIQGQLNLTANISVVALRDESGIFSLILKVHKRLR